MRPPLFFVKQTACISAEYTLVATRMSPSKSLASLLPNDIGFAIVILVTDVTASREIVVENGLGIYPLAFVEAEVFFHTNEGINHTCQREEASCLLNMWSC